MTKNKLCEFCGDECTPWDGLPKKERLCKWAGFDHCTLHKIRIFENDEGWRECCVECKTPFYEVTQ